MKAKWKHLPAEIEGMIYIYGLIDPRTNGIRYIGKTNNPQKRYPDHFTPDCRQKTHKQNWINLLLSLDMQPDFIVLEICPVGIWAERERYWIAYGRKQGWRLTNSCAGGKGAPSPTPESRRRMSEAHKGKRLSPRQYRIACETLRNAKRVTPSWKGGNITWAHKISAAKMGHTHSEEARQNQSEARKRYYDSVGRKSDIVLSHLIDHPEDYHLSNRALARKLGLSTHHHAKEGKQRYEGISNRK